MKEERKDIEGYEGLYQVSNLGNVRGLDRIVLRSNNLVKRKGLMMEKTLSGSGYLSVKLSKNGKKKRFFIHRLVGKAFIPNPDNKPYINHKDYNRTNNKVDNLEWVTPQENTQWSMERMIESQLKKNKLGIPNIYKRNNHYCLGITINHKRYRKYSKDLSYLIKLRDEIRRKNSHEKI